MTEAEAEVEVAPKEYSFRVVERRNCCNLDYYRSPVTQAKLDSLHECLHVPNAISTRAP